MVPLTLTVWARPGEPSFLFDLEGAEQTQAVYAASLPDALTLLNQLAPHCRLSKIVQSLLESFPAE
ncbi:hypothetical protein ABT115_30675 [Streptomyces sp. NPDC001832]|uniref:hypothetical protein n=1 Tax=Streptomyces sp. NPDC001832 TaxID=3154527 RepID=UPI00332A7785